MYTRTYPSSGLEMDPDFLGPNTTQNTGLDKPPRRSAVWQTVRKLRRRDHGLSSETRAAEAVKKWGQNKRVDQVISHRANLAPKAPNGGVLGGCITSPRGGVYGGARSSQLFWSWNHVHFDGL